MHIHIILCLISHCTVVVHWFRKRVNVPTRHLTDSALEEVYTILYQGPSCLWSHSSWIYNYQCNQCLPPLTLWVWIPLRQGVLITTLCDQVCQWLVAGRWFSLGTPISPTNKTDNKDITEILLKVAFNTINQTSKRYKPILYPLSRDKYWGCNLEKKTR